MAWWNRHQVSRSLIVTGWTLLMMGLFLLLIHLLMTVAEVAGGTIALVGLVLLVIGLLLQRRSPPGWR